MKLRGIIARFDTRRGFGWLRPVLDRPGAVEIFFHRSVIEDSGNLPTGCEVEFELVKSIRGPQAYHVRAIPATLPDPDGEPCVELVRKRSA